MAREQHATNDGFVNFVEVAYTAVRNRGLDKGTTTSVTRMLTRT